MNTPHAKSPCCQGKIRKFGSRRRQCVNCHRTFRIRKKKRGRKPKRESEQLALQYLNKALPSLRVMAEQRNCGKNKLQARLKRSLAVLIKKNCYRWKSRLKTAKKLIVVADAIWYRVKGQKYTIYVVLLRPLNSNQAVVCPPVVCPGHEGMIGWRKALQVIPEHLRQRVLGLVCDGAGSLVSLVKARGWILQRCHFHLLAAVKNYLSCGPRSTNRPYAQAVLKLVQMFLTTINQRQLDKLTKKLNQIYQTSASRGLRRVFRGLVRDQEDYHAYLKHPRLNLPATSNAAESEVQQIRDLMYRCRGFRGLAALQNWLVALTIFKPTIACNGKKKEKNQPN